MAKKIYCTDKFSFYATEKCGIETCKKIVKDIIEPNINDSVYGNLIVLRDVYGRLISFYENKILNENELKFKYYNIFFKDPFYCENKFLEFENITFEEFIEIINKIDKNLIEEHLAPQSYCVMYKKFDHVIMLDENFSYNFEKLLKKFGIENFVDIHENKTANAIGENLNILIEKYYTKKLIEIVNEKYKMDFKKFKQLRKI